MPNSQPAIIVLTRDQTGNRSWGATLRTHGFITLSAPMITIAPVPFTPTIAATLSQLPNFDWLIFTSARGVKAFAHLAKAANINLNIAPPVAVVGPATATAARRFELKPTFIAESATAANLAATLTPIINQRLLLARTNLKGPTNLAAILRARGADVTELTVYRTQPRSTPSPKLELALTEDRIRCLVFASPSAVQGLTISLTPTALNHASRLPIITVGPTTTAAARSANFTNLHQAAEPNIKGLIGAITSLP